MKIESKANVEFIEEKSRGNDGYARGWFFWVHSSFKPSLDIRFFERVNEAKTVALRDRRARRLGHESLDAFKKYLKDRKVLCQNSVEYKSVMKHSIKDAVEEQCYPPLYCFEEGDKMESRCGGWYLIVTHALPDQHYRKVDEAGNIVKRVLDGTVGFDVFRRATERAPTWQRTNQHVCTQSEFVELLKTGQSASLSLRDATEHRDNPNVSVSRPPPSIS